MARKRVIDPEFWSDEEIGHWSFQARLFYIGIWNFSDDEGRFKAHDSLLKSQIFPYDNKIDIIRLKQEVAKKVQWYVYDGQSYGFTRNFMKHQRIDRPSQSKLPAPPACSEDSANIRRTFDEHSTNAQRGLDDDSRLREEKLREEKLREVKLSYVDFEKSTLIAWNSFCEDHPELSKTREITGKRRDKLKLRFSQESFKQFKMILDAIAQQPFCLGVNNRGWKVTLDWLIENDTNFIKVLEMRYRDDKPKTAGESAYEAAVKEAQKGVEDASA
jgi:hypothetical protein